MARLVVRPQRMPLTGVTAVPGDKSISHRAVMLGALGQGASAVRGWLPAGDTIATLDIMRALGVKIAVEERSRMAWDLTIHGRGVDGLREPAGALDCRNAGTCMRLLAGIMAGQSFPAVLDGSQQLRNRPMGRIVRPLRQMGAKLQTRAVAMQWRQRFHTGRMAKSVRYIEVGHAREGDDIARLDLG